MQEGFRHRISDMSGFEENKMNISVELDNNGRVKRIHVIVNDEVNHIIIGKDQKGVVYQWIQKSDGYSYAEICFGGVINMYQKATSDINPATDTPYAVFSAAGEGKSPIWYMNLTGGFYYGFYAVDGKNDGPDGINGAIDLFISTSYDKMKQMIPGTPGNIVSMKISLNSGTATLTWESTGVDSTKIYRKDVSKNEYSPDKWFPPQSYHMTGCSAKLWMKVDEEATKAVKIQHPNEKYTGLVQLTGINDKTVTLVAVTTEKKDVTNPFIRSYDFVALGTASTTILSSLALLLLLVSVLII